jgi:hypothetical protein
VREYAALPVTAGRALALATLPTMICCLSPLSRALADDGKLITKGNYCWAKSLTPP